VPRIAFLGSKRSGLNALNALLEAVPPQTVAVILCPDDRNDERCVLNAFSELAARHAVPLHVGIRRADIIPLLKGDGIDIAIVHGWYQLLSVDEAPDILFLGFHYSPLPEFRGNAPLVWQIISGRAEIGVSFFQLTAGIDDGPLVEQKLIPLGVDETINDALIKVDALVAEMISGFSRALLASGPILHPQPRRTASYCGLRVPEDGAIDWRWSARRIHDFIRAQTRPYPGAYSRLPDGSKLTIWSSRIEPEIHMGVPGAVVAVRDDHVIVAAGEGAVQLYSVQPEGGHAALPAPMLLKSLRIRLN